MAVSVALVAALLSTVLISLAPNLVLLIFPSYGMGEGTHSKTLSLGQSMAAGGLIGDVFLHTLPHSNNNEEAGLWIIGGFVIFLVADMVIRSVDAGHNHGNHHHHHHGKEDNGKNENNPSQDFRLSPTILLNLAGDALHNFTDGLAIGASFSIQSSLIQHDASLVNLLSSRGGLATISILLHELPHELGDFATLVKAGCSKKQAILLQFATALAALLGTIIGVFTVEDYGGEKLLYITAGGFVYLAAVTILPEVLDDGGTSFPFRFAQVFCFCSGVAFLWLVAVIEHQEGGDLHHHGHDHSHHHRHFEEPTDHHHAERHEHTEHHHNEHHHNEL